MELYIVRHGETNFNKLKILQGNSVSSHLNEIGKKQAQALGIRLKNIKFDCVYYSDLERAENTAQIITNNLLFKAKKISDIRLRERDYGEFEGHTWAEVGDFFKTDAHRSVVEAPPKGESLYDVKNRVESFVEELKEKYKNNENILVVTHHGVVIMLFVCLLGLTLENHRNFYFDNASLSIFHIGNIYNKLKLANDTSHLNQLRVNL